MNNHNNHNNNHNNYNDYNNYNNHEIKCFLFFIVIAIVIAIVIVTVIVHFHFSLLRQLTTKIIKNKKTFTDDIEEPKNTVPNVNAM